MKVSRSRYIACVAILSAIATVLMFLEFPIPALMPSFIKLDISELPALIASFSLGPVAGVVVCLVKNLINLINTHTGGVGELCNFLLGASFAFSAGLIYKYKKSRIGAIIASIVGSVIMGILSYPLNKFITYPIYYNFMDQETIISMYQAILPSVKTIDECLLIFNLPFTIVKGLIVSIITFLIYKPLSPIIKGYHTKKKEIAETDSKPESTDNNSNDTSSI